MDRHCAERLCRQLSIKEKKNFINFEIQRGERIFEKYTTTVLTGNVPKGLKSEITTILGSKGIDGTSKTWKAMTKIFRKYGLRLDWTTYKHWKTCEIMIAQNSELAEVVIVAKKCKYPSLQNLAAISVCDTLSSINDVNKLIKDEKIAHLKELLIKNL